MQSKFWKVWLIPVLIGIVSAVGLISALTDDGIYDMLSWVLLGIPVVVMFWFVPWRKSGTKA
jgi:hypothetical protein